MRRLMVAMLVVAAVTVLLAGAVWGQAPGRKATTVLQATASTSGEAILYPLFRNQITVQVVEYAPGAESGRHYHPNPVMVYVISGELTLEEEGQATKVFKAGQAFIEGTKLWMNLSNRGNVPAVLLAAFLGEQGVPLTRPVAAGQ